MIKSINLPINIKYIILPIVYIILGYSVYTIIKKIIDKSIKVEKIELAQNRQRVKTIKMLLQNVVKYITIIFVILSILSIFGVNVKSIVTGLGITTAIIGLAFQDIAKDIIAGISIITEEQYDIGDTIQVGDFMGEVIFLGLKTTKIRDYKGAVKIISNRYMDQIINYSLEDSLAVVDVATSYENTPAEVEKVLNDLAKNLKDKIPNSTSDVEVLGINELEDSSIVYRVTVKVKSMQQYVAERIMRKEIKNALDNAGLSIPYPQIEVHHGK